MAADREILPALFHATEVEPRRGSHHDLAGGTMDEIDTVNPVKGDFAEKGGDEKTVQVRESSDFTTTDDEDDYEGKPTEDEKATLRRVCDHIPLRVFLIAIAEMAERFTYNGLGTPFQNYVQFPYPGIFDSGQFIRGAINGGQQEATGLSNFFNFWCYVTPILGAIVADQYLGRYNTIFWSAVVYLTGCVILFLTSLPFAIENGAALGGLVTAMIVIGLGCGGIKSNVSALIAEQFTETRLKVKTLKSGEKVIVDPSVTIQTIYMMFYFCINIGSLSPIATTELEQRVGFWSAYLLPLLVFLIVIAVLIFGRKIYVQRPPQGAIITRAFKAVWIGIRYRNLEAAKPSYQHANGNRYKTPWNDLFIDEVRRALVACKIFAFLPIYWLVYSQITNNLVSQAAEMQLHGLPNDIVSNIDPIALIICIPIMDRFVYPGLRRIGIRFKPVTRITFGFFFGSLSMILACVTQALIYSRHGDVNVGLQTPTYFFIAISEIFASVTSLEYAYTKAPASMKSFVMSLNLFTTALGSALAETLTPVTVDPKLTWMYAGIAITSFIAGIIFWFTYRRYNKVEESLNSLEGKIEQAGKVGQLGLLNARRAREHEEEEAAAAAVAQREAGDDGAADSASVSVAGAEPTTVSTVHADEKI